MEVFFGDTHIRNDGVHFSERITPFPEAAGVHSVDLKPEIRQDEENERHSHLPRQKLRPIRCNGRTLPEYSDNTVARNTGLEGALLSYHGELGFLAQLSPRQLSLVNGGTGDCANTPPDVGSGSLPENGGRGIDGMAFTPVDVPAMQQISSEINAECRNLAEGYFLEAELSSSSDDDSNLSEVMTEPLNHKRKRKRNKKLKLFLRNMVTKVIQKQEQMHRQLVEMIEEKEKERIIREEAWKQQEIERAKKDQEARAQERSRSLALISFIQNFLGHEIPIPNPLETSLSEKDEGEIHNQNVLICDPCSKRWPKSEVQALITVRTSLDHKFLNGPKSSLWEEVAVMLSNMGYNRSAKKCKEKWENINKYYKRTMENGRKCLDNGKTTCPYFQELDILYKSGLINGGNTSHYMRNETIDKCGE
ncbi:hypothetical protein NMG60_11022594 [Bertholletia excelsa]